MVSREHLGAAVAVLCLGSIAAVAIGADTKSGAVPTPPAAPLSVAPDPDFEPIRLKDGSPAAVRAYFAACDVERAERILDARRIVYTERVTLQKFKAGSINRAVESRYYDERRKVWIFHSPEYKRINIRHTEDSILRHNQMVIEHSSAKWRSARELPEELEVGLIGHLPPVRVVQIIDRGQMVVDIAHKAPDGDRVKRVWLVASTKGLVDDQSVQVAGPVLVSGTKRYQTGLGSRTIYQLETIDVENYVVK